MACVLQFVSPSSSLIGLLLLNSLLENISFQESTCMSFVRGSMLEAEFSANLKIHYYMTLTCSSLPPKQDKGSLLLCPHMTSSDKQQKLRACALSLTLAHFQVPAENQAVSRLLLVVQELCLYNLIPQDLSLKMLIDPPLRPGLTPRLLFYSHTQLPLSSTLYCASKKKVNPI